MAYVALSGPYTMARLYVAWHGLGRTVGPIIPLVHVNVYARGGPGDTVIHRRHPTIVLSDPVESSTVRRRIVCIYATPIHAFVLIVHVVIVPSLGKETTSDLILTESEARMPMIHILHTAYNSDVVAVVPLFSRHGSVNVAVLRCSGRALISFHPAQVVPNAHV